jgi:hypothetical protein
MDGIPASGQLTFLTNDFISQGYLDMTTFHQPSLTPGPKTQEGECGLNLKMTSDVRKNQLALAKNLFDINCSGWKFVSTDSGERS